MKFHCYVFVVAILLFKKSRYHITAQITDIIGGAPANISQFPYQVSLRYNNGFICGGIILDDRHILTAAHCVCWLDEHTPCPVPADKITVAAGSTTLWPIEGVEIAVDKIFVYENYVSKQIYVNDIAVLRLSKNLEFNSNIQSYPIATTTPPEGTKCVASGWGRTSATGPVSNILMHINISIISHMSCASNSNIFYRILCAERGSKTPWQGDSGGPLNCGGKIAGIVSLAHPSSTVPSFYTDIAQYKSWISNQLKRDTSASLRFNWFYYLYAKISMILYSQFLRNMSSNPFILIFYIIGHILDWIFDRPRIVQ